MGCKLGSLSSEARRHHATVSRGFRHAHKQGFALSTRRHGGIQIGSLVELTFGSDRGKRGIVVESWTPTVYDNRSYSVVWQDSGTKTIVYANEIVLIKNKKVLDKR